MSTKAANPSDLRVREHEAVQEAEERRREAAREQRDLDRRQRQLIQEAHDLREKAGRLEAEGKPEAAEQALDEAEQVKRRADAMQLHRETTDGTEAEKEALTEALIQAAQDHGPALRERLTDELKALADKAEAMLDQLDRVKELRSVMSDNRRQVASRDGAGPGPFSPILRDGLTPDDITGFESGVEVSRAGLEAMRGCIDEYGADE